jgi:outer membrane protein assembly factor BamB
MITNVLSLILFTLTIGSNNGDYTGEVIYAGSTELLSASFKLYDQKGNMLYHIINPEATSFFISNSGQVFATSEQMLFLYELNGNIRTLRKLFFPNGFAFSPDNTLFFASDRDGIYAYSMKGSVVYQFKPGRLFTCTEQAKKMAIVSSVTLLFYEEGNLISQKILSNPFVRKIYFSEDRKFIYLELPDTTEMINIYDKIIRED